MIERLSGRGYQIEFVAHAAAILRTDFPEALDELCAVLFDLAIPIEDLVRGGGGETVLTQSLRRAFAERGWRKHVFNITKMIDGVQRETVTHEMDHVRNFSSGNIALEIEWNNKDPFFDRDLENFKRLHAEGAISAGVIITRGETLQDSLLSLFLRFAESRGINSFADLERYGVKPKDRQRKEVERRLKRESSFARAWAAAFCADKYGQATTHWRKLKDRTRRGVGNPCPLLLIGIPDTLVRV